MRIRSKLRIVGTICLSSFITVACQKISTSVETTTTSKVSTVLDIQSQKDWTNVASSHDGLTIENGLVSGEGVFISQSILVETPVESLVFEQTPDWSNWNATQDKVAPNTLMDAPVLLTAAPGEYYIFGRLDNTLEPDQRQKPGPGAEQLDLGGYHVWHSRDMENWSHNGPVTEHFSRWVTSAEYVDGKFYIYYDYPNDQDPHLYIDDDLFDGKPGENMGRVYADPSDGSDAGFLRDLDGKFHLFIEDWSPINASQHAWDSPLAQRAMSPDGVTPFEFQNYAVDQRTKATGKSDTYPHPHWHEHPDWQEPAYGEYDVHEPDQNAYGDWTAIRIGDRYYLFADFEEAGSEPIPGTRGDHMKIARFTSERLDGEFEFVGSWGKGHPDPTIAFAEGRFYLITQTPFDYVSSGPWVDGVTARAGVDADEDGLVDEWTDWQVVQEHYDYVEGFSRVVSRTPAALDLQGLPSTGLYSFEFKISVAETAQVLPVITAVRFE